MPLDEKELLARDANRNIGEELLQAVESIIPIHGMNLLRELSLG